MIFDLLYKSETEVLNLVEQTLKSKERLTLTYFNQHCFNIYNSDNNYKKLLDNKFEVFPDGTGIYLALRLLGYKNLKRFNATDLNEKIFSHISKQGTRLFLVGGKYVEKFLTEKTLQKKINVVGYENGFFNELESELVIGKIKDVTPEAVIIGMGVPKQELFAEQIAKALNNKVIICVGNFLEFYFATDKRAPAIFRNSGLEWLFRLLKKPSRLWKRYIIGIPVFVYHILKLKFNLNK